MLVEIEAVAHIGFMTTNGHCVAHADRLVGSVGQHLWPDGRRPSSDLKPHLNDCLGNCSQAGVVVAGVRAYELVGLIDSDSMALGGDPLGLFDDDP